MAEKLRIDIRRLNITATFPHYPPGRKPYFGTFDAKTPTYRARDMTRGQSWADILTCRSAKLPDEPKLDALKRWHEAALDEQLKPLVVGHKSEAEFELIFLGGARAGAVVSRSVLVGAQLAGPVAASDLAEQREGDEAATAVGLLERGGPRMRGQPFFALRTSLSVPLSGARILTMAVETNPFLVDGIDAIADVRLLAYPDAEELAAASDGASADAASLFKDCEIILSK